MLAWGSIVFGFSFIYICGSLQMHGRLLSYGPLPHLLVAGSLLFKITVSPIDADSHLYSSLHKRRLALPMLWQIHFSPTWTWALLLKLPPLLS